jgi:hypothetical protein
VLANYPAVPGSCLLGTPKMTCTWFCTASAFPRLGPFLWGGLSGGAPCCASKPDVSRPKIFFEIGMICILPWTNFVSPKATDDSCYPIGGLDILVDITLDLEWRA